MFAAVILIGAALLMLPISAQERTVTPFHEALFTLQQNFRTIQYSAARLKMVLSFSAGILRLR